MCGCLTFSFGTFIFKSDETRVLHGESARNQIHARNKLQANKLEAHDKLKAWNCLFSGF